jgi:type II secretory pathway component GspD/PulD (secretin)
VNTHVRTTSGEPIVIGGLIQQNEDTGARRTPFLSRIPLLGNLFQSRDTSVDRTELVIYIVPHVSQATTPVASNELRVQSLYERLVAPRLPVARLRALQESAQ